MTTQASSPVQDIASPDVILMEVILYCIGSLLILLLIDGYAVKKLGGRQRLGYQMLRGYRGISILVVFGFTAAIAALCLMLDFSCTRGTLSYFGMPYLIAVMFYMVKAFRRVYSETKGRFR